MTVDVYRGIDASADPELASRLRDPDTKEPLNLVSPAVGEAFPVAVSIVYHDPEAELLVLVLPESERHLELSRRSELLAKLAVDGTPVPEYAGNFATVFGTRGLARFLELRAESELERRRAANAQDEALANLTAQQEAVGAERVALKERSKALDEREGSIAKRERSLDEREQSLEQRSESLSRRAAAVEQRSVELSRERAELGSVRAKEAAPRMVSVPEATKPTPRVTIIEEGNQSGDTVSKIRPGGAEVKVSITEGAIPAARNQALETWLAGSERGLTAMGSDGLPQFSAVVGSEAARFLRGEHVQVKLQLHRFRTFPVPTIAVGPAGAFDEPRRSGEIWTRAFDLSQASERAILEALSGDFRFALDLYDEERRPIVRRILSADLSDNAALMLSAADAHLETIPLEMRSVSQAVADLEDPDYDRFGLKHPERASFRDDRLKSLGRPGDVLRALSVARRFSKPEREEYLAFTRSYSISRWRQRRRMVMARALELGLWMGPRLSHFAVSEGLASSRKHLVSMLLRNFAELVADGAHGLDDAEVRDNWDALQEESAVVGITQPPRSSAIHSEEEPEVSGTIGGTQVTEVPEPATLGGDAEPGGALVARLDDKDTRLDAAIELANAAAPSTLPALFRAVSDMTRGEAGRVLGAIPAYGAAAVPYLVDGLRSRKGFIRQGCALALGVIGGDDAIEALCDLLVTEPTEIWREVARAIGVVGGAAASALVVRVRARPEQRERIAWALANVVVGDGARVVESLARGRDAVAAGLAKRAREMAGQARREHEAVRAAGTVRDVTVNRAFSRRFFESMAGGQVASEVAGEASAPAMMLDEADLTEIEEDAEPLDESDLIPT